MAINDIYTLPKYINEIPQMKDLLQAEQKEIDLIVNYVLQLLNELNISTSTKLVGRYEKIFGLESSTINSITERRAKIIAKLNNRGITTVESIEEISKILTNCNCFVTENFGDYSFTINIEFFPSSEKEKLEYLLLQIDEIKPAHLNCYLNFVYNKYKTFEPFMCKELGKFRNSELRENVIDADEYFNRNNEYRLNTYLSLGTRINGVIRRKGEWFNETNK